ncbi:MAG: hypothetical protein HY897_10505 [Deltaproteobacteria bacterium]|nr:hypothetical protein [Deltaproteobacteria bacterium]
MPRLDFVFPAGLSLALVATWTLPPSQAAFAAEPGATQRPKVVIVSMTKCCASSAWPEAEVKVALELATLGARVQSINGISAAEHTHGNQLAAALDDQDVAAALRIVRTDAGSAVADLLFRDGRTKRAVSKRVAFDPLPGQEGVPVAALKIVELLTAGAAELALRTPEPSRKTPGPGTPSPPAQPVAPAAQSDVSKGSPRPETGLQDVALRAGAGAALAPGTVTLLPAGFLAVEVAITPRLAVEGEGSLSLPRRTVPYGDAKVDFTEGTLRGWALWEALRFGPFSGAVGGGAGAVFVDVRGHTTVSHKGVKDLVVTGYAGVTSRLGWAFSRIFELGLSANLGAAVPRVKVRYSLEDSPAFGWPFVEAGFWLGANVF